MQKITEVDKAEVGKFYLVPCVVAPLWLQGGFREGDWVPILGDIHDDKEIGFSNLHYHYDFRFISVDRHDWIGLGSVVAIKKKDFTFPTKETPTVWKKKKCLNAEPSRDAFLEDAASRLMPKMQEKTMTCMTCPHKGFRLNQADVRDGVVQCKLHGLKWNVESGSLATLPT